MIRTPLVAAMVISSVWLSIRVAREMIKEGRVSPAQKAAVNLPRHSPLAGVHFFRIGYRCILWGCQAYRVAGGRGTLGR